MSDFQHFQEEARNLVSIDLSGVDDSFEPIPPGTYDATVTAVEVKPNNAGTGRNVNIRFDVDVDGKRRVRTRYCPLQGRGAGIATSTLKALGVEVPSGPNPRVDVAEAVGAQCRIQFKASTYNGEPSDEIVKVLPSKAQVFQP